MGVALAVKLRKKLVSSTLVQQYVRKWKFLLFFIISDYVSSYTSNATMKTWTDLDLNSTFADQLALILSSQ